MAGYPTGSAIAPAVPLASRFGCQAKHLDGVQFMKPSIAQINTIQERLSSTNFRRK
jgi:hypothetical protein